MAASMVSDRTRRITRVGSAAGDVVAIAGALALLSARFILGGGEPWEALNDAALLVMTAAIAPLMLSFYELGGRTPTPLAQLAQTLGWLSVLSWCGIQVAQMAGMVELELDGPATGIAVPGIAALACIGLWIAGANLLAGSWLTAVRWLGVAAGLAAALFTAGLLSGGVDSGWTSLGGVAYLVLLPPWAFLMARLLGR